MKHTDYVFLPVRDLPKQKSGKFGVKALSVFLDPTNADLSQAVKMKEEEISDLIFRLMKSRFPSILQQFYEKNSELILLRLSNTLNVSQNFHVDALHSYPNSQFGVFMALNSNQRCHVCV